VRLFAACSLTLSLTLSTCVWAPGLPLCAALDWLRPADHPRPRLPPVLGRPVKSRQPSISQQAPGECHLLTGHKASGQAHSEPALPDRDHSCIVSTAHYRGCASCRNGNTAALGDRHGQAASARFSSSFTKALRTGAMAADPAENSFCSHNVQTDKTATDNSRSVVFPL